MKKLFILLFLVTALLTGCGTAKQLQVVREVSTDTVYLNHIQYDSIYVQNDHSREYHPSTRDPSTLNQNSLNPQPSTIVDTIFITDKSIEYKYRLLRDTVRIVQIDSIPVIREVEVVKTERFVPGIYKVSLWLCIGLLLAIILFIAKKFFL